MWHRRDPGGGTRSEKWWGCAAGRWKLDPKRSREKWNLGPKRSNSVRIGSYNTTKDRFGVGGWEKIPQKDRARSCQSEKRGSKPRHICITHHIGSTPPGGVILTIRSWFQTLLDWAALTDGTEHIKYTFVAEWYIFYQILTVVDIQPLDLAIDSGMEICITFPIRYVLYKQWQIKINR